MKISKQSRRDAKQLFRACVTGGVLDEKRVRETVSKVAEAKPRGYMEILSHFQRLLKLEIESRTAVVEGAVPVPADLRKDVTSQLERIYGPGLNITFRENPALIGGLKVKVGSDVYDGSVQQRLNALAESF
ncbi:MAG: F0F1 ATP synthase subunit delta [Verrucomicrobiota bacterium]